MIQKYRKAFGTVKSLVSYHEDGSLAFVISYWENGKPKVTKLYKNKILISKKCQNGMGLTVACKG